MAQAYFDGYFRFHPTEGTAAGFHQYDAVLEDYSQPSRDAEIAFLSQEKQEFASFRPAHSNQDLDADIKLVSNAIDARLLELQNVRNWQRNPDGYSSSPTYSIFILMSRNFAPPEQRLQSVIAREQKMPANFSAARQNLQNVPKIYVEIALEQIPGIISFFQNDVPKAFTSVADKKLLSDFHASNGKVIAELQSYQTYLTETVLPNAHGDFAIGADNYRKKLLYEEMVDIPLDRLLQIGYDDLHKNQAELKRVAAQIDPSKTPAQILEQLEQDHPQPDQLLQAFRDTFNGLVEFIQQKQIVTLPSQVRPMAEETPPFGRALSSASMDTPGPYENKATEAFFNVTLPEATWSAEKTKSWMEGFNRGTIISTAVHEAYPGHYTQFLWLKQVPDEVRKLVGCGSNSEGWAHYSEQLMLDEGYGNNDPKLRIGQLQDALLRDARYIAGIQMHTGKMTLEEATQFFVKEGYQTQAVAEREAKRGTSDPTYLVYTLGKLEILKLRTDYKQKMGDKFGLEQFHNEFLQQGYPPIKIIREKMLGNDSPVL
ncbi:MAG TPA: DUF885 domain-containing protein [Terriglobales bacterium]|nr:DUF885 domain-containing protein [Terriglobales bacterium]